MVKVFTYISLEQWKQCKFPTKCMSFDDDFKAHMMTSCPITKQSYLSSFWLQGTFLSLINCQFKVNKAVLLPNMVAFYLNYYKQALLRSVLLYLEGLLQRLQLNGQRYPRHTRCCIWLSYVDDNYILTLNLIRMRCNFNKYNTFGIIFRLYCMLLLCLLQC